MGPSPSPLGGNGDTGSSAHQPAHSCVGTLKTIENMVDGLVAQKTEEWSREKAALQSEVDRFRAQVDTLQPQVKVLQDQNKVLQAQAAEQSRKCDEWQKKHQLLAKLLQNSAESLQKARNAVQGLEDQ